MLLKLVPKHIKLNPYNGGLDDDPRWVFFKNQGKYVENPSYGTFPLVYLNSGENNTFFYRKNGDNLEPLGKFVSLVMQPNQATSIPNPGYLKYVINFNGITIFSDAGDELYYTDEPPAAGSVPLTINDIPNIKGGKKYKKYRKNTKKYRKNTKKYRKNTKKYKKIQKNTEKL